VSKNVSTRSAELRPVDNNGDPLSWASTTPTYQFNDIKYRYMAVNQYLPNAGDDLAYYRSATHLAVAGGTVKRIRNGSMSLVTGGTQALSREAPVIFSAQVDNRVYFVDGVTAKYYNATTNAMSSWTATGTGIPYDSSGGRPTLIAAWRRRILLAGLRQNANTVYATKQGDPGDLNTSPTTRHKAQQRAPCRLRGGHDRRAVRLPHGGDLTADSRHNAHHRAKRGGDDHLNAEEVAIERGVEQRQPGDKRSDRRDQRNEGASRGNQT
jgi:hypothetical protein